MVEEKAEKTLQQGIALFDSVARLKLQQLNGRIAAAAYDEQLREYTKTFKGYLDKIDDKSAYLRKIFTRINLADNEDAQTASGIKITEMRKFLMSFIRHWKGKGYFRTFPRMFS